MRLTSRMLLVLPLACTTANSHPSDSPASHTSAAATPNVGRPADRMPIATVAYQASRSPARFSVRWIGQDGHDYVGPGNQLKPSDIQDIHLELGGLDPRREVVFVDVTGTGTDQWQYDAQSVVLEG